MNNVSLSRELAITSAIALFAMGLGVGHLLTGDSTDSSVKTTALPEKQVKAEETPRYEVFISPIGAECLRDNHKGSLSCNFVKFESAVSACETVQLAKNTFLDKEGETVVFPLIAGECEAKVKREAMQALALEEEHRRKGY